MVNSDGWTFIPFFLKYMMEEYKKANCQSTNPICAFFSGQACVYVSIAGPRAPGSRASSASASVTPPLFFSAQSTFTLSPKKEQTRCSWGENVKESRWNINASLRFNLLVCHYSTHSCHYFKKSGVRGRKIHDQELGAAPPLFICWLLSKIFPAVEVGS